MRRAAWSKSAPSHRIRLASMISALAYDSGRTTGMRQTTTRYRHWITLPDLLVAPNALCAEISGISKWCFSGGLVHRSKRPAAGLCIQPNVAGQNGKFLTRNILRPTTAHFGVLSIVPERWTDATYTQVYMASSMPIRAATNSGSLFQMNGLLCSGCAPAKRCSVWTKAPA